jgi:hypothetical protein
MGIACILSEIQTEHLDITKLNLMLQPAARLRRMDNTLPQLNFFSLSDS